MTTVKLNEYESGSEGGAIYQSAGANATIVNSEIFTNATPLVNIVVYTGTGALSGTVISDSVSMTIEATEEEEPGVRLPKKAGD